MRTRVRTIELSHGDVQELRIYRNRRTTRLVVYDEDRGGAAHPSPTWPNRARSASTGAGQAKMNRIFTRAGPPRFLPIFFVPGVEVTPLALLRAHRSGYCCLPFRWPSFTAQPRGESHVFARQSLVRQAALCAM
jgi:hypothetical protein